MKVPVDPDDGPAGTGDHGKHKNDAPFFFFFEWTTPDMCVSIDISTEEDNGPDWYRLSKNWLF